MATTPVKARGGGYGLDAELAQRAAEKYDYEMEDEARQWIEAITGREIGASFGEGLRDGVILCELANKIHPGVIRRIETKSKMPFKLMENVSAFLKACRTIGVNEYELFETVDLFELKDLGLVVRCLHALGRAVQKNYPSFNGPTLGVKEAAKNERQFTEEQIAQARNAPSLLSLGSMRTMERLDVSRANDVTFGADATKPFNRPPPPPPPPSAEKVEMVSRARAQPSSPELQSTPAPTEDVPAVSSGWSQASAAAWPREQSWKTTESAPEMKSDQTAVASPVSSANNSSVAELSRAIQHAALDDSKTSPSKSGASPSRSAGLAGLSPTKPSGPSAMDEAQQWIEDVLNEKFLASFGDSLKDGIILCTLMNTIKPGIVPKIQTSTMPFKQMENITAFLKACRVVGVAEFDLFETVDLFELKNVDLVVKCIHALGRAVQKNVPEFTGPTLGVKEATVNKRQFSASQLKEAAAAVPILAHGSSRVMERPDFDRSASVTFGAMLRSGRTHRVMHRTQVVPPHRP
ncbi:hypothetical protein PINS_up014496 [Pythium insidiosum]|nr:hypothetical protein PINS_up014496 [Pythium insidiosum]